MPVVLEHPQKKSLARPDEIRSFDKGQVDLVTVNEVTFGRAVLQPGWRWSTCVKPLAQTPLCEASHLQYHVSGRLHVLMADGEEAEFVAGDVASIDRGPGPAIRRHFVSVDGLPDQARGGAVGRAAA